MLNLQNHLVFLGVDDTGAARAFYESVLGLRFDGDEMGTLLFDLHGVPLRISAVEQFRPQSFTVLGWTVADIAAATAHLTSHNVEIVRYPGINHDEQGIAMLGPVRIVWFKDPAGNLLSFTQE